MMFRYSIHEVVTVSYLARYEPFFVLVPLLKKVNKNYKMRKDKKLLKHTTMKKLFIFIVSILVGISVPAISKTTWDKSGDNTSGILTITTNPDLLNLVNQWSETYTGLHKDVTIRVEITRDELLPGTLNNENRNRIIISGNHAETNKEEFKWKAVVGRDVLVPVIHSENPVIGLLYEQGIPLDRLMDLLNSETNHNWATLMGIEGNYPLNLYISENEVDRVEIAGFTGIDPETIKGIEVANSSELQNSIQKDLYGIGFCRLSEIVKPDQINFIDNLSLLPIDRNGNGKLDYVENIYSSPVHFLKGVWIGKYPQELIHEIYFAANDIRTDKVALEFITWLITDGQNLVGTFGYNELVIAERQSVLNKLNEPVIQSGDESAGFTSLKSILVIIIVFALVITIPLLIFRTRRTGLNSEVENHDQQEGVIREDGLEIPNGIYFDKSHTWAFMNMDGTVKIGIDDFLLKVTGPYSRVQMKSPGEYIYKGETFITVVQNGKQLTFKSPVSGKIVTLNTALYRHPDYLTTLSFAERWMCIIEPSNWLREIQFLQIALNYKGWLKNEITRLKDFLVATMNTPYAGSAGVAYQDGGEIKTRVLQNLGPEIWEDFQKKFIDKSDLC